MNLKQNNSKIPNSIILASVFIVTCAFALVAFSIALVVASVNIPNNPVYATQTQSRGFITVTLLVLLGAGSLLYGVKKLLTVKQPTNLLLMLAIPLIIGTIGETIDIIGTESTQSNLIGGGILLLFIVPIILLRLPASIKWYSKSPKTMR